jgi:hypothetical protein
MPYVSARMRLLGYYGQARVGIWSHVASIGNIKIGPPERRINDTAIDPVEARPLRLSLAHPAQPRRDICWLAWAVPPLVIRPVQDPPRDCP